jgi:hypothetical protein
MTLERATKYLERHKTDNLVNDVIRLGIELLSKSDTSRLFQLPVQDGNYLKIISKPMCIQDMKLKLLKNAYKSVGELNDDVYLMVENCYAYNGRGKYSEVSL